MGYLPYPKMTWVYIHPTPKWPTTLPQNDLPPPPKMTYEILFYYLKNKYSALRSFFEQTRLDDFLSSRKASSNSQFKKMVWQWWLSSTAFWATAQTHSSSKQTEGRQSKRIRHTARPMVFIRVYRPDRKQQYSQRIARCKQYHHTTHSGLRWTLKQVYPRRDHRKPSL